MVELKTAHYNLSWLEFRMVQITYAKIKIVMQDILPVSPMSGREFPLDLSSVDFKVFKTWSSVAAACQPSSASLIQEEYA